MSLTIKISPSENPTITLEGVTNKITLTKSEENNVSLSAQSTAKISIENAQKDLNIKISATS